MFDKKMPIIQFKDIEKKYDENAIITHFNLDKKENFSPLSVRPAAEKQHY